MNSKLLEHCEPSSSKSVYNELGLNRLKLNEKADSGFMDEIINTNVGPLMAATKQTRNLHPENKCQEVAQCHEVGISKVSVDTETLRRCMITDHCRPFLLKGLMF